MTPYTLADVGCYIDGVGGIYMIDCIVEIAVDHGMAKPDPCNTHEHAVTCFDGAFAGCEDAGEIEDECDEYMNAQYAVDGAFWGRSEGDWGLWPVASEEERTP